MEEKVINNVTNSKIGKAQKILLDMENSPQIDIQLSITRVVLYLICCRFQHHVK